MAVDLSHPEPSRLKFVYGDKSPFLENLAPLRPDAIRLLCLLRPRGR
jgi:hypothetical protein